MSDKIFDPSELNLDFWDIWNPKKNSSINNSKSSQIKKDDSFSNEKNIEKKEEIPINSFPVKEEKKIEEIKKTEKKEKSLDNKETFLNKVEVEKPEVKREISDELMKTTLTDKSLLPEEIKKKMLEEEKAEKIIEKEKQLRASEKNKIIFDINITKVGDLLKILAEKEYDFFTIEPTDTYAKIKFFDNNIKKEEKYIKLPDYFWIVTESKAIAKLKTDTTHLEQKWDWEISIKDRKYEFVTKIVPWNYWEKAFVKIKETQKKAWVHKNKKISLAKAFTFLAIILFIVVLLGWMFLTFVLFNSNSLNDLVFFKKLWIDALGLRDFIKNLVNFLFIIIIFIESIFLASFIFKAFLAKKDKARRITFSVLSVFLMIIVFISWWVWMKLVQQIQALKWDNYWIILAYDNTLKKVNSLSEKPIFDKKETIIFNGKSIKNNSNMIWPVEIKYEIDDFIDAKKDSDNFYTLNKVTWDFDEWSDLVKPIWTNNFAIFTYSKKKLYEWKIILEWTDLQGEYLEKTYDLPKIDIAYVIDISKKQVPTGWIQASFNSNSVKPLWKTDWYLIDWLEWKTPEQMGEIFTNAFKKPIMSSSFLFKPNNIITDETIVWMDIIENENWIDKYFIIEANSKSVISGEISYKRDINNDKKYNFIVKNPKTADWNWWIKEYIWNIDWKVKKLKADFQNQENSSKITHIFKKYWGKIIKLTLVDATWKEKTFIKRITLKQKPQLKNSLRILNEKWSKLESVKYDKVNNTYQIRKLWVPTKITLDARNIQNEDRLYNLQKIEFDLDWDWNFEQTKERKVNVELPVEKNYRLKVKYVFEHTKDSSKTQELIENIYINTEKKDYNIIIKVNEYDQYAPSDVTFDASDSWVKWVTKDDFENIIEFAYDYWDGTPLDRTDAKTTHRYVKEWHYDVKLTITTKSWTQYVKNEKIILKPAACKSDISASTYRNVETWQNITFSSKATCSVESWDWDFWDWNTSVEPNPEHSYWKSWKYTVKLTVIFKNNNKIITTKKISIVD